MLLGFILLGLGLLFFLEVTLPGFVINYGVIWPVIIMIVSIYYMVKERKIKLWSMIFFFVGLWSLLINVDVIIEDYHSLFFPIILMIIGLSIIYNTLMFSNIKKDIKANIKDGVLDYYGIFSGVDETVTVKDFKGANVYAIFGGCELDFSGVELKDDSVAIVVYSIFGGSDIRMPVDYNVVYTSMGIFGGNENKCKNENVKGKKTIYLNCISIFGGTEIK